MASKLPVLWVDPSHVAALAKHNRLSCNTFARNYEEPGFIEYLPANRCRTCSHWDTGSDMGGCCPKHNECPADGSGFCHSYEPKEAT